MSKRTIMHADYIGLEAWARSGDPIAKLCAKEQERRNARVLGYIRMMRWCTGYARQARRLEWIENWHQPRKPRRINGRLRRLDR